MLKLCSIAGCNMQNKPILGVNIDHIATLRQARRITTPDPLESLPILEELGVPQVTCHLREDRRHIQDHDILRLLKKTKLTLNLEMAPTKAMFEFVLEHSPQKITLVPEKREEITTEGGLDAVGLFTKLQNPIQKLKQKEILTSLFIAPDPKQIKAAVDLGCDAIEIHTGDYANLFDAGKNYNDEFEKIKQAAKLAKDQGLLVYAGHGLNTTNLKPLLEIKEIIEYNIGHSIIGRAVFVGLKKAIQEILEILDAARS